MIQRFAAAAAAILLCASPVLAQEGKPLRTGVDGSFPPHAFPNPAGGTQGFNIDVFTEVAKRMKRPITIDAVSFSTLIPGMAAGRYDFVAAPTTVTKERAENLLFTAGYLWTYFQFGIKKGSKPLTGWADLKGKVLAVNKGTPYETVGKKMAPRTASRSRPSTTRPTPSRPCSRAAPTPPSWATPRSPTSRSKTRCSLPTSR